MVAPPSQSSVSLPLPAPSAQDEGDHTARSLTRNFSISTYHSTLSLADLNKMSALGAVARRKRGGSAGSDQSIVSQADGSAEGESDRQELEYDDAVELGIAKVLRSVSGVVGRAKMVGYTDSGSESEYEGDRKTVGLVVKREVKCGDMRKSMGRERQREEGVVGWWHTRGE